jgi:hypothetical protein
LMRFCNALSSERRSLTSLACSSKSLFYSVSRLISPLRLWFYIGDKVPCYGVSDFLFWVRWWCLADVRTQCTIFWCFVRILGDVSLLSHILLSQGYNCSAMSRIRFQLIEALPVLFCSETLAQLKVWRFIMFLSWGIESNVRFLGCKVRFLFSIPSICAKDLLFLCLK